MKLSLSRKYAPIFLLSALFCIVLGATPANAQPPQTQSLAHLKQWIGKFPFDKIKGKTLLNDKPFQAAFKAAIGEKLYTIFYDAYKCSGRYFQSDSITEERGVMTFHIQELAGDDPFETRVFIDTARGTVDACWTGTNYSSKGRCVSTEFLFLHTGKKIPVQSHACYDFNIASLDRAARSSGDTPATGASQNMLMAQESPNDSLAGTWTGRFQLSNSNGKLYTLISQYTIFADPSRPGAYKFKQQDTLTFLNPSDSFSCNNKNTSTVNFEGDIVNDGPNLRFIQKRISNPACGVMETDRLRLEGDKLKAIDCDGGKIKDGYWRRS